MFNRFTNRAHNALELARHEAHASPGLLGPEFILLGLLGNDCGARRILERMGVDVSVLEGEMLALIEKSIFAPHVSTSSFRTDALRVLELAKEEAGDGSDQCLGTEHLLMGIVREADSLAAKLLVQHGVRLLRVREEVARLSGPDDGGFNQGFRSVRT